MVAHLEEALGVYRGEFMEGFSLADAPEFELWLEAEPVLRSRNRKASYKYDPRMETIRGNRTP